MNVLGIRCVLRKLPLSNGTLTDAVCAYWIPTLYKIERREHLNAVPVVQHIQPVILTHPCCLSASSYYSSHHV